MALDLQAIIKEIESGDQRRIPPVDTWFPEREGAIDIHIDSQMCWFHEGAPFQRDSLVKLFSSILRKEGDTYFLVTPAEKLKISVDDVPFEVVGLLERENAFGEFVAVTNTEDLVPLDTSATMQLRVYQGVLVPYLEVRKGLFARVSRHVFYQMAEHAELRSCDGEDQYVLVSGDVEFVIGNA
ncbi:Uncharacterised protein [BD1-7 clade bacterium]|uniref:DUF1285 domain-containing protein n=1 Tax=BD1-7 clade bacterium TaxID=2029982 RepID=A0A5S9QR56_9GAMM|nr:Uncharacterised protein [BD1-7 clade bacterium]CAA0122540.1 Uncharacterised protein [BD1-7 clade bacterium]